MRHRKSILTFLCWAVLYQIAFSQMTYSTPLFATNEALDVKINISFKELRKETNDSTYMDGVLYYRTKGESWDSLEVKYRKRGKSRLDRCFFTPMRIKIKKKKAKGTPFEGNKALKLVLPCDRVKVNNQLVMAELLCYKIYERISPFAFNTRIVNLEIVEQTKDKPRKFEVMGFFLEDDDALAKRHGGKILKEKQLYPPRLQDTTAIQHALFQYLISNLDWHTYELHNSKLMQLDRDKSYIVLPYDFDRSGLVNAYYAGVHPDFETSNVRQRLYRGFCRDNPGVMQWVREQYLSKKSEIFEVVADYHEFLPEKEVGKLSEFLEEFFEILSDDTMFQYLVLDKCRTK